MTRISGASSGLVADRDGTEIGGGSGGGDGAILDGADSNLKATVRDYTNSNPLAIALTDSSGDQIDTLPISASSLPLPAGAATAANQSTIIGHVDGLEALLTTIDSDTSTLAGAVSGSEMQVDIVGITPDLMLGTDFSNVFGAASVVSATPAVKVEEQGTVTVDLGANNDVTTELTTADLDTGAGTDTRAVVGLVGTASGGGKLIPGSATDGLLVNLGSNNDVAQATHDNLNANANLQISDADASASNPVPVRPNEYELAGNTNHVKKYYTNSGSVTDGIIWSPAAGKRWYVTLLTINVSAACTVTIEDDLTAGDDVVYKAEFAANSGVVLPFGDTPMFSGEDAADLLVTTTAGNVYITAVGYEV